jgi:phage shock protein C
METSMKKRLYRNLDNNMMGGVCAGLGDYFQVDPTVVRLVFLLLILFGLLSVFIYIILWIIVPVNPDHQRDAQGKRKAPRFVHREK